MTPTAAEIAEALVPMLVPELERIVDRALSLQKQPKRVSTKAALRELDYASPKTLWALLAKAGRRPYLDKSGRRAGVYRADLDALLAGPR